MEHDLLFSLELVKITSKLFPVRSWWSRTQNTGDEAEIKTFNK